MAEDFDIEEGGLPPRIDRFLMEDDELEVVVRASDVEEVRRRIMAGEDPEAAAADVALDRTLIQEAAEGLEGFEALARCKVDDARELEFNPSQPRDEQGQWTSGGGAAVDPAEKQVAQELGLPTTYHGEDSELRFSGKAVDNPLPKSNVLTHEQTKRLPIMVTGASREVSVADLRSTQDYVQPTAVKNYMEGLYMKSQPIVATIHGDEVLLNGNHNVVAAKLRGEKTISVQHLGDFSEHADYIKKVDKRFEGLAARGRETLVHKAADTHATKISVALRYAFAMGRRAIAGQLRSAAFNPDQNLANDAAVAVASALADTLRPQLLKALAAGGDAGLKMLGLRAAAFNPDQPRDEDGKWTDGGTFYHGTTSKHAAAIEKEGLKPGSFMTDSKFYAKFYGNQDLRPGETFEMFEVTVPKGHVLNRAYNKQFYQSAAALGAKQVKRIAARDLAFNPDQPRDENGQWTSDEIEPESWHQGRYKRFGGDELVTVSRNVPPDAKDKLRPYDHVWIGKHSQPAYGEKLIEVKVPARELIAGDEAGEDPNVTLQTGREARWVPKGMDPSEASFTVGRKRKYRDVYGLEKVRTLAPKLTMRFDASNENAAKWAKKHAGELIKDVSETTRKRVRLAVEELQEEGDWELAHDRILAAVGDKERADLIARHESHLAASEGQRQGWNQAVDEGLLPKDAERIWIVVGDNKVCPICEGLDGKKAVLNEEYEPGIEGPPAHVQCRCTEGIA